MTPHTNACQILPQDRAWGFSQLSNLTRRAVLQISSILDYCWLTLQQVEESKCTQHPTLKLHNNKHASLAFFQLICFQIEVDVLRYSFLRLDIFTANHEGPQHCFLPHVQTNGWDDIVHHSLSRKISNVWRWTDAICVLAACLWLSPGRCVFDCWLVFDKFI